jgi:hypothetical protein
MKISTAQIKMSHFSLPSVVDCSATICFKIFLKPIFIKKTENSWTSEQEILIRERNFARAGK